MQRLFGALALAVLQAWPAGAQPSRAARVQPLEIIGITPEQRATPSTIITIAFDRPVAETLAAARSPGTFIRVTPDIEAAMEWRDPSTIRIVPLRPLQSGTRYQVRVDTTFVAMDGSRLRTPRVLEVSVALPSSRLLSPVVTPDTRAVLAATGVVQLMLTAPIDTRQARPVVRLDVQPSSSCPNVSIDYAVSATRRPTVREGYGRTVFKRRGHVDTLSRIVEFAPLHAIPEFCDAVLTVPVFTAAGLDSARYEVRTAAPFDLADVQCLSLNSCAQREEVTLTFSAPVTREQLRANVRLHPANAFVIDSMRGGGTTWTVPARLEYRSRFRVTFDTAFRDVHGRRFAGRPQVFGEVADATPALMHLTGVFVSSRHASATLAVRHLNADSVELRAYPVPYADALMPLQREPYWDSLQYRQRGGVRIVHAVRAPFNGYGVSELALPTEVTASQTGIWSVTARVHTSQSAPDTLRRTDDAGVRSAVAAAFLPRETPARAPTLFMQFSDLAVHARLGGATPAAWVTHARTGTSINNATITLYTNGFTSIVTGTTSADGVALLGKDLTRDQRESLRNARVGMIEVRAGSDRLFLPITAGIGYQARGDVRAAPVAPPNSVAPTSARVVAWVDRPFYRPGELVHVGSLSRSTTDLVTNSYVTRDSVRYVHEDSDEDPMFNGNTRSTVRAAVRTSAQGFASDTVRLRRDARTGTHLVHVELKQDTGWIRVASAGFEVAEYRTPEFLLVADSAAAPLMAGDSGEVAIQASYLHGAPVPGADVRVRITPYADFDQSLIKGLPNGFFAGRGHDYSRVMPPAFTLRDSTGDDGKARVHFTAGADTRGFPRALWIEATVTDVSRSQIATTMRRAVHPASFYLGLRTGASYRQLHDTAIVSVVALSVDGRRLPNRAFDLRLLRRRMVAFNDSRYGTIEHDVLDTVAVSRHSTGDSVAHISLRLDEPGELVVMVAAHDEQGRRVLSTQSIHVSPRAIRPPPLTRNMALRLSDSLPRIGDTVNVMFDSPFRQADAWITFERDGVVQSVRQRAPRGGSSIRVPVTGRDAPVMYIGVTLISRDVDWQETSRITERTLQGYVALRVDMRHKKLAVELTTDRPVYDAGDSIRIRVRARDHRNHPVAAEATIWAVDEGNLALGDYTAPRPFGPLHWPLRSVTSSWTSAIFTLDRAARMRDASGRLTLDASAFQQTSWNTHSTNALSATSIQSLPVSSIEGALSIQPPVLRKDFRTTAFFITNVLLDADGSAIVVHKLPDNLSRYKVFAVVADSTDRVGYAESAFSVSKPLLIRAALPRFVRTGDSVFAGGVVSTTDGSARLAAVTMRVDARDAGSRDQRVVTASPRPVEARFGFVVPERDSTDVLLQAVADSGGSAASDAVVTTLPVLPVMRARVHAVTGTVRDAAHVRIALPRDTDIRKSSLTLRIGNSPLPLLQHVGKEAMRYPFDCSEQLASNIRVLSALLALQRRGYDVHMDSAQMLHEIDRLSRLLVSRVNANGAVRYWPGYAWTSPWLTGYAGIALLDARDAGVDIDGDAFARLGAQLRTSSTVVDSSYGTAAERQFRRHRSLHAALAYAWYARRSGAPQLQVERRLMEQRDELAWEDRAWLAELVHAAGDTPTARHILGELWRDVKAAGALVDVPTRLSPSDFPSAVRAPSRLLSATLVVWPEHPSLGALAERVMSTGRAASSFWNTQDYGWMVPALAAWTQALSAAKATVTARVPNDRPLLTLTAEALSTNDTTISIERLAKRVGDSLVVSLVLESDRTPAHFVATVAEVSSGRVVHADRRGMTVDRWIERLSDGTPITDVAEGEVVRVRLRVRAESRRDFVALEDWLPAGLEVIDPALRTAASLAALKDDTDADARDSQQETDDESGDADGSWWWFGPWDYRDLRDDKVRWFARQLRPGTHTVSYLARATTAGKFVRPPAHAEEMYNPGVNGRSEGGWFGVRSR